MNKEINSYFFISHMLNEMNSVCEELELMFVTKQGSAITRCLSPEYPQYIDLDVWGKHTKLKVYKDSFSLEPYNELVLYNYTTQETGHRIKEKIREVFSK
jgi:hypothetical protein